MEPLKKGCYQGVLVKAWQLNHWEGLPGLQSEFKASLGKLSETYSETVKNRVKYS